MALYIPHSIFHLERLLYVRPETFGPYYVADVVLEDPVPEKLVIVTNLFRGLSHLMPARAGVLSQIKTRLLYCILHIKVTQ